MAKWVIPDLQIQVPAHQPYWVERKATGGKHIIHQGFCYMKPKDAEPLGDFVIWGFAEDEAKRRGYSETERCRRCLGDFRP